MFAFFNIKSLLIRFICVICTFLFFVSGNISAQYYSSGADPARLKWRQIKTPYVRLVFEKDFQKEALRLAYLFDSVAPLVSGTMKHRPHRIDILIHNQMSYSNGFLSWAPRRVEFFSNPHQNITSEDWLADLAIHEYRHAVQADKLNKGATKIASILIGQQAVGITLGLNLPMWFIEGDAVVTETTLTNSGRGRSFEFNQELKAQLVERGLFSFDKAYMGSYKDKVANYYKMGYPLVAMARQEYGAELWEKAIENTGRGKDLFQMERSIKKATGKRAKKLYEEQFTKLKDIWTEEANSQKFTHFEPIYLPQNDYEEYLYPQSINDSIIICELRGTNIRSQIVEINISTSEKKTLVFTGIREEEPISANENIIVWSELKYHTRWDNESFSVIRVYDRKTGKTKTLGKKTRYFAPAIHTDLQIVAAVETTTDYRFYVSLIDVNTGKIIKRIPSPHNQFIMTPSWNSTGKNLITILLNDNGKSIYTLDTETETWNMVLPHSFDEKCHPIQSENDIWYAAKGAISQEIYHYNIITKEHNIVTSSKFGAAFPAFLPDSKQLIYSHYTNKGYHLVKFQNSDVKPDISNVGKSYLDLLAYDISLDEVAFLQGNTNNKEYKVEKYSKFNLINLHSWAPIYADFNGESVHPGVSLMSQNLLGTCVLTGGFNIDPSYRREKLNFDLSYFGFYPVFGVNFSYGDEWIKDDNFYRNETDTFSNYYHAKIHHYRLRPNIKLPLNLSSGNYQRRLIPEVRFNYQYQSGYQEFRKYVTASDGQLYYTGIEEIITHDPFQFFGVDYSLYFYNLRHGTGRDVASRMGQVFQVLYAHCPFGNYDAGKMLGLFSRLYFPGLFKHHSLFIDNNYQIRVSGEKYRDIDNYSYYRRWSDIVGYPRGYVYLFDDNRMIYEDNIYLLRVNYSMPLFNPDISLGRFAYIKRFRTNLFYDMSIVNYSMMHITDGKKFLSLEKPPSSCGFEFYTDVHFLRFTLPFSVGYRYSYIIPNSKSAHHFLLSTSFSNFLVNGR